jgi:hypothetical protein
MTENDRQADTLGARLDNAARRLAARHLVAYAWASGLAPALERAAELTEIFQDRFDRFEQDEQPPVSRPGMPPLHDVPGRGQGRAARPPARPPFGTGSAAGDGIQAATEDAGQPLPSDLRARLREVAGPGAEALRVHHDGAADIKARIHRADAVTTGRDVHIRDGLFRPDEPVGFALLAHEAAHVTALLGQGGAARRDAAGGRRAEEEAALAREQEARDRFGEAARAATPAGPAVTARFPAGPAPHHAAPAALPFPADHAPGAALAQASPTGPAAAAYPMTAPADRDLPRQPPFDVEELRRQLISDLMRQLRTEFERGG